MTEARSVKFSTKFNKEVEEDAYEKDNCFIDDGSYDADALP